MVKTPKATEIIYQSSKYCQDKSIFAEYANMLVNFCLKMKDAEIGRERIDYFEVGWQEDLTPRQLALRFDNWLTDECFFEERMPDLKRAAWCQLHINPLK